MIDKCRFKFTLIYVYIPGYWSRHIDALYLIWYSEKSKQIVCKLLAILRPNQIHQIEQYAKWYSTGVNEKWCVGHSNDAWHANQTEILIHKILAIDWEWLRIWKQNGAYDCQLPDHVNQACVTVQSAKHFCDRKITHSGSYQTGKSIKYLHILWSANSSRVWRSTPYPQLHRLWVSSPLCAQIANKMQCE